MYRICLLQLSSYAFGSRYIYIYKLPIPLTVGDNPSVILLLFSKEIGYAALLIRKTNSIHLSSDSYSSCLLPRLIQVAIYDTNCIMAKGRPNITQDRGDCQGCRRIQDEESPSKYFL